MKFSFVTLFQNIIEGYFSDSILKRAIDSKYIDIDYINPRDYTEDKHNKVDRPMIGGGAGMLMTPQPLFDTIDAIKNSSPEAYIIVATPVGKPFRQNDAKRLAKKEHIVFISGRYEGMDERFIEQMVDEVFSIGDFILTGGELPSMVMSDAIARNVDGVLGNSDSLSVESFELSSLEAPSFSKPKIYNQIAIPSEFLKGNHGKISDLKNAMAKCKTKYFRPDMHKNLQR
ncbi:tRNA (guanosine(37)-N1)-methyltransferase TrmD [Sulfurovum sp. bin170]|uniref:tRNA (guanosine(37)-N1)-methyltransferase TrmD n=1 Tax=Sulfurovum sp. bin170 TaxID=2695268 RepID=UPI0013DEB907|nr:tRNA (guanosine(37)-N1)-methyltransferase TrmD [Sulfurovum sp. bin170]NEW61351.1 tRNA (guanosine(37)-N1)-methyltransferase TrmD [Sulfurovum sp. bin170]